MEILISLAMIVKNEQDYLARCLDSIKNFVDEIIIVDTGSTDATKLISAQFTDKIYDFDWCDDFSRARNFAFSKAKGKYIMWLDADDYISPDNLSKLLNLKEKLTENNVDIYMLKYETAFDSDGNSTFAFNRERIIKNDGTFKWEGAVHEAIVPHGQIECLDIAVKHLKENKISDPKRNLKIYRKLIKNGKTLQPREQYYYARELFYNKFYKKAKTEFLKFLKDGKGWKENNLGALEMIHLCNLAIDKIDVKILFESLNYDAPRANFLCLIGDYYLSKKKFKQAIFFYKNALECKKDFSTGAFINEEYFNVYPALQLCVCFYQLGDALKAKEYNDLALKFNSNHKIALKNDIFFKKMT